MKIAEIENILRALPVRASVREQLAPTIREIAREIKPALNRRKLRLVPGSTSPSSSRSISRIYLERRDKPVDHNWRNSGWKYVIRSWEWETKTKWGFHPISRAAAEEFLEELREELLQK